MTSTQHVLAARPAAIRGPEPPSWRGHLHGSELRWALAFLVPYAAVVLAFGIFPIGYGLWMAHDPALYAHLFASDDYYEAAIATLLYVGIGVNVTMILALLLSGFFMRKRWWIKALLVLSLMPWALPIEPTYISFHWMLVYPGFLDNLSYIVFGVDTPDIFNYFWLSLGSNIMAYTWKTLPFWTLILFAGRMAIPQDLYDAAAVDGAGPFARFSHLVVPLLGNLYLVCTLLATIWMIGDYNTPDIVSGGTPHGSTEVLATVGVDYMMEHARPDLGVAAVMTALPILIPLGIFLIRRLQRQEVQL